jgi:hypothetical protein
MRFLLSAGVLGAAATVFVTAGWSGSVNAATCTAAQLRGAFTVVPNSAGLGHISYRLRIENRSSSACSFQRHPAVQLLGFRHRQTPTHATFEGHFGSILIPHGHALVADARFSPDIPSQGEPLRKACERVSHFLRVGPVTVPLEPPTRVCGFGAMLFGTLHVR